MFTQPTVADFKTQFDRDFPYGLTLAEVRDSDIQKAIDLTSYNINEELFDVQGDYSYCYLLLSAHYMVMNLRASSQGISGQYNFLQAGKGVGSVSESFGIPQHILDSPDLGMLCKTNYGAQYVSILLPRLRGQCFTSYADAHI